MFKCSGGCHCWCIRLTTNTARVQFPAGDLIWYWWHKWEGPSISCANYYPLSLGGDVKPLTLEPTALIEKSRGTSPMLATCHPTWCTVIKQIPADGEPLYGSAAVYTIIIIIIIEGHKRGRVNWQTLSTSLLLFKFSKVICLTMSYICYFWFLYCLRAFQMYPSELLWMWPKFDQSLWWCKNFLWCTVLWVLIHVPD